MRGTINLTRYMCDLCFECDEVWFLEVVNKEKGI